MRGSFMSTTKINLEDQVQGKLPPKNIDIDALREVLGCDNCEKSENDRQKAKLLNISKCQQ